LTGYSDTGILPVTGYHRHGGVDPGRRVEAMIRQNLGPELIRTTIEELRRGVSPRRRTPRPRRVWRRI